MRKMWRGKRRVKNSLEFFFQLCAWQCWRSDQRSVRYWWREGYFLVHIIVLYINCFVFIETSQEDSVMYVFQVCKLTQTRVNELPNLTYPKKYDWESWNLFLRTNFECCSLRLWPTQVWSINFQQPGQAIGLVFTHCHYDTRMLWCNSSVMPSFFHIWITLDFV